MITENSLLWKYDYNHFIFNMIFNYNYNLSDPVVAEKSEASNDLESYFEQHFLKVFNNDELLDTVRTPLSKLKQPAKLKEETTTNQTNKNKQWTPVKSTCQLSSFSASLLGCRSRACQACSTNRCQMARWCASVP